MATLISSVDNLKANLGAIDANFNFASIKSFVEDVERDIIAETIGDDALAYFLAHLTGLDAVPARVLQLLQRAEAYLSVLKWSQTALFRLTDKALYVAKSTDGAIISDKKLRDLRNYCEESGFNFLDKAIALMEANLDSFTDYADSGTRQTLMQGFIKTASDFNEQRRIDNSRLTFLSMHAIMLDVQDEVLPRTMGADYYAAFKERYLDDELTADENKLLPFIKKAVAFLTISRACNELPIKVGSKGLLINKYNDTREYDQADPADAARAQYLSDDNKDKGERKLLELQNYLLANAGNYAGYTAPLINVNSINSCNSGTFML